MNLSLDDDATKARDNEITRSFESALNDLVAARQAEGARLGVVMKAQLDRIAELTEAARSNPSRTVEAIRQRLEDQVTSFWPSPKALTRSACTRKPSCWQRAPTFRKSWTGSPHISPLPNAFVQQRTCGPQV